MGATQVLELIDRGFPSDRHPAPLLFIHGGWHGAWCWDNFLHFFADNGFRAVAVNLRGHGASTMSKPLSKCSIADYVDDVGAAADTLGCEPVLIGHSMGGFVVQQYLQRRRARAAVLMSSMPAHAARRAAVALRIMRRHPLVTVRAYTLGGPADLVNTPHLAREHFFTTHTPESVVTACAQRLQAESGRAGGLFVRSKPSRVTTPLLILGGEDDGAVTAGAHHATARAYGVRAELFPAMGHNLMLEPGWPDVAKRIYSWLANQGI